MKSLFINDEINTVYNCKCIMQENVNLYEVLIVSRSHYTTGNNIQLGIFINLNLLIIIN